MKIQLLTMLLINNTPLTSQERKHLPFHQVNAKFIEAKYETVIADLPAKIDKARDVIIKDSVVRNMFGYTIALSYFIGAILESSGFLLMEFGSLQEAFIQTFSSLEYFGFQWYLWWYGAGDAAPWFFPDILGTGGDPNLKCSSEDFFRLVRKYNLDAGVAAFSNKRDIERFILLERLEKEITEALACVLYLSHPKRNFKEHEEVVGQVQELLGLFRFHRGLIEKQEEETSEEEISFLDQEITSSWEELSLVIEEVYRDVYALNVNKNFALIVSGFLNLMGMVGAIIITTDVVKRSGVWSQDLEPKEGDIITAILTDFLTWFLSDGGVDSHYVMSLGAVFLLAAPYFWGYSYSSFLIFLRDPEPECGADDRDTVFERYSAILSIGGLLASGVSSASVLLLLEDWRRDMEAALHCLFYSRTGHRVTSRIDMVYNLASARLRY